MAPEQLAGQEVSVHSDIYALGLVLHEMFPGKRAFEDGSEHTTPAMVAASGNTEGISVRTAGICLVWILAGLERRARQASSAEALSFLYPRPCTGS
jgi:serine/threonine protein kinase